MTTIHFLTPVKKLELLKYQQTVDKEQLKDSYISFSGSLRQHPHDPEKVILLAEIFSNNSSFYEFRNQDIGYAEKLPNIVNSMGDDVSMVMIWVKKGSLGIRSSAFVVEQIIGK
ncbi:MAG: inorganic pyrophosphatase Ppa [Gammaproteobacteria bacterium]|nr:inorganic pyrophosphatase Ppa [Gammaproteobacteria bacterium]